MRHSQLGDGDLFIYLFLLGFPINFISLFSLKECIRHILDRSGGMELSINKILALQNGILSMVMCQEHHNP